MQLRTKSLLSFLVLFAVLVWQSFLSRPDEKLHFIACDVGQGDAILIIHKSNQILVDGGPNNSVLDCLSRHMPFWDNTIELVILTHPQKDHYGGLTDVFKNYEVDTFVENLPDPSNQGYQVLKSLVGGSSTKVVVANTHTKLRLGLMSLDILWPEQNYESSNPNDYSVVAELSFKNFKSLLTGDIEPKVIQDIIKTGKVSDIDVLKVPHHGSNNGLTQELLDITNPDIAVISVGKNSWGHPRPEVLGMLDVAGVQILRTDILGDVEIVSDGNDYQIETQ